MRLGVFAQQGAETGLLKVAVVGKYVRDTFLLTDYDGSEVRQAPRFIRPLRIQRKCGYKQAIRHRHDTNGFVGKQSLYVLHGQFPYIRPLLRRAIEQFNKYKLTGDKGALADAFDGANRLACSRSRAKNAAIQ